MNWFYLHVPFFEALARFFEQGGVVQVFIAGMALLLWTLIFERLIYLYRGHEHVVQVMLEKWRQSDVGCGWRSKYLKAQLISMVSRSLERNMLLIRSCVALALLLGLLGTVSGMVQVFEALSVFGNSNPRHIASGFSRATIPTMAGMVVSLSGLGLSTWLSARAEHEKNRFSGLLIAAGNTDASDKEATGRTS